VTRADVPAWGWAGGLTMKQPYSKSCTKSGIKINGYYIIICVIMRNSSGYIYNFTLSSKLVENLFIKNLFFSHLERGSLVILIIQHVLPLRLYFPVSLTQFPGGWSYKAESSGFFIVIRSSHVFQQYIFAFNQLTVPWTVIKYRPFRWETFALSYVDINTNTFITSCKFDI
jgi:hypothetical protein